MVSLITQNRLDNVIFKYLDWKLNGLEKRKGRYTVFTFVLPDEEHGILGWKKSGVLYVYYKIKEDIQNMFGLESPDALDVIARYVVDRYNLEVKNTFTLFNLSFISLKIDTI
jgi:hypothetical protein